MNFKKIFEQVNLNSKLFNSFCLKVDFGISVKKLFFLIYAKQLICRVHLKYYKFGLTQ